MMFQVYQWLPSPYDNSSVPDNIRDLWQKYHITLKCEGAVSTLMLEITTLSPNVLKGQTTIDFDFSESNRQAN